MGNPRTKAEPPARKISRYTEASMDRRRAVLIMTGAAGILATGCEPTPYETPEHTQAVKDRCYRMSKTLEGLESEVGEFQTKDWQEVVPKVSDSVAELRTALDELKTTLDIAD
jgi:hypothetical protein